MLELFRITKSFGGVEAISNVSLVVGRNELVACVGPNGAGKTTLLNIMSGWLTPDSGEVRLAGRRIDPGSPHTHAVAGIVRSFQTPKLFSQQTALQNVMLAASAVESERLCKALFQRSALKMIEARTRSVAMRALNTLQIGHLGNRLCGQLSGGERRTVELCAAMARAPHCLLLDEPTAGLSPSARKILLEALRQAKAHMSIFLVEHDLDFVGDVADRTTVLSQGRLVGEGSSGAAETTAAINQAYAS